MAGSRTFAGGTDQIVVPSGMIAGLTVGHVASVGMWFYPTSSLSSYQALCDTSNRQLSMLLGGSASSLYVSFGPGQDAAVTLSASWTLNAWNHVLVTSVSSAGSYIVYKNGTNITSGSFTSGQANFTSAAWTIGGNPSGGGAAFQGSIAELCVWNSILNSTDAANLGGGALASTIEPASIVGYFPLRGVQSPEPDCSTSNGVNGGTANSNDGVVTGTTTGTQPSSLTYQTSPVTVTASGITFFLPQTTSVLATLTGGGQNGVAGGISLGSAGGAGGTAGPKVVSGLTIAQAYKLNVGNNGATGGDTWFSATGTAQAIGGGSGNSNVLDTTYAGGAAGSAGTTGGGGGGGSGGTSSPGNPGSNGSVGTGGAGGVAVTGGGAGGNGGNAVSAGTAGTAPGGGGGGGGSGSSADGLGAAGQGILSWPVSSSTFNPYTLVPILGPIQAQ